MPLVLIKNKVEPNYLLKIDKKISQLAEKEINNSKLGFSNKIDYKSQEVLQDLRDLFIWKSHKSDCLCDVSIDEIKFYIDRITNKNCI